LSSSNLNFAALIKANLTGANLAGAGLIVAKLLGANLRGADLREADLRAADLRNANLNSADLRGANLRGADLGNAILKDTRLLLSRYKIRQSGERELSIERKHFRRSRWTLTSGRNCTIGITNSQYWTLADFGRSPARRQRFAIAKKPHSAP
jgi:hypothetical protein